jgi:pyrroline-5-carboxylate reductase
MGALSLEGTVLLVGAGKMGGALLQGWLAHGLLPERIAVIDPAPPAEIDRVIRGRKISLNPDPKRMPAPAAVVLAVKPQLAAAVAPSIAPFVKPNTVVISIMAGRALASLEAALPAFAMVVRAMPNLPAAVGRGISVAVPNKRVDAVGRALAGDLLAAVGAVEWVGDEGLLDAVTAVSGSGPAYLFLLAESLAKAGAAAGLPADLAERLARATITGAGELLYRSQLDAATLRRNVTSEGGTTAAALDVLTAADGLDLLMRKAVAAAARRSHELAR